MKDLVSARKSSHDAGKEREPPQAPSDSGGEGGRRVNPTVSAAVISEARNALEAAHASGDYRHQSVADLIRAALRAYAGGLPLTRQAGRGRKKRHTVELPGDLFKLYGKLPSRSRGVIVERALRSFLAKGFGS